MRVIAASRSAQHAEEFQSMMRFVVSLVCLITLVAAAARADEPEFDIEAVPCCEYEPYQAVVWTGTDSTMTFDDLASYCGPILWFSPDEPLVEDTPGLAIRQPAAFPFEEAPDSPVVYYRVRTLIEFTREPGTAYAPDVTDVGNSVINFNKVAGINLDYFFYYPSEEGFGGHKHDVESTEMKIYVWKRDNCPTCPYSLIVVRVNCKAHGVLWYDNTLEIDQYAKFPMTVLVEEGKHAGCTDKNGDGYYTPGYDVNVRVNDAWGVRDVIRGGGLFSGGFESWFAKVRTLDFRVFPPLPEDSPLRGEHTEDGEYAPDNAKYEVRPFPHHSRAADDPLLVPFIEDKGYHDWPEVDSASDIKNLANWVTGESFVKSLTLAFRTDGNAGFSAVFPLFVFWHFADPVGGGWIVSRVYWMDTELRDFGYNALYTTSASRWIDGYFSVGVERDMDDAGTQTWHWVAESGFKFRANIKHSPLSFLSKLTDFWGIRVGVKYTDLLPVTSLGWVVEVGGGTF
jgi:hypothetical protein